MIAILAFSTTTGYKSELTVTIKNCTIIGKFSFAFDQINAHSICPEKHDDNLPSVVKGSAIFFTFVGVVSCLYCIVAVFYYTFLEDPKKCGPGGTGRDIKSYATVVSLLLLAY